MSITYTQVTIWHNHDSQFYYYAPGHRVTPVFTYVAQPDNRPNRERGRLSLLDEAWNICNSYPTEMHTLPEYAPIVAAYRALRLRSLSKGDLIQVGLELFEVTGAGFDRLGLISLVPLNIVPRPDDNFREMIAPVSEADTHTPD